jgi:hypothetical protein
MSPVMWIFCEKQLVSPFVLKKLAESVYFLNVIREKVQNLLLSCYSKPIMIEVVLLPVGKKLGLNTTGKSSCY